MNTAVISFSERGYALGMCLASYFVQNGDTAVFTRCAPGGLAKWTKEHFEYDALIFIGSCGIAVRAIAPFLVSKTKDPAVVVIDELASYVISLLSGHIGGANSLAVRLARFLDAVPIITTATDVNGVFSIDTWAINRGLKIANSECIQRVSARLLAGGTIRIQSLFPIMGRLPQGVTLCREGGEVLITWRTGGNEQALRLVPPIVTLGIGCKKDVPVQSIEHAYQHMLQKADCHPLAVVRACSIDLKAREPGILEFCRVHALPYTTFSAQKLSAVPGRYTASPFVRQVTGVDNVCERSAVLGSGEGGRLLAGKEVGNGVTMALAVSPYTPCFDEERET